MMTITHTNNPIPGKLYKYLPARPTKDGYELHSLSGPPTRGGTGGSYRYPLPEGAICLFLDVRQPSGTSPSGTPLQDVLIVYFLYEDKVLGTNLRWWNMSFVELSSSSSSSKEVEQENNAL